MKHDDTLYCLTCYVDSQIFRMTFNYYISGSPEVEGTKTESVIYCVELKDVTLIITILIPLSKQVSTLQ